MSRAALLAQVVEENTDLPGNVQVVAVVVTVLMLALVIELVRRRRLTERYALAWMFASVGLVGLALWRDGLDVIGDVVGVANPVNGFFLVAFGVVYGLLLNFSVVISRLSEESKILAQTVSRLDAEVRGLQAERRERNGGPPERSAAERSAPGR